MLGFPDSIDDIAYTSFLADPGVSRSIYNGNVYHYAFHLTRCATASLSIIVLFSAHVLHSYVITGRMYSSCIFLCIFMLALLLFMMLSALPMAAQPSAILFLIEAGHHDLSSPSFLGIRKSTSLMVSPSTRCILRPASLLVLWKSVSILVSHMQIKFFF